MMTHTLKYHQNRSLGGGEPNTCCQDGGTFNFRFLSSRKLMRVLRAAARLSPSTELSPSAANLMRMVRATFLAKQASYSRLTNVHNNTK